MSRVKRNLIHKDFYRSYVARMKAKGLKPKTEKEHKLIIETMGQVYADELLDKGIVQLPWRLGDIYLKNYRWKHFLGQDETGKMVFKMNDHTDNIIKKFFWNSQDRVNKKAKQWVYSPDRTLKRALAYILINKKKVYPDYHNLLSKK